MIPRPKDSSGEQAPAFTQIAPFYDELMKDVPYTIWARYVISLARRHGCEPQRILDLACGTGTVALLLADQGYEMVGIDGSEAMLEVARHKAESSHPDLPFLQSDLRSFTAPGTFDLVICLYDSLNNILEPEGLEQAFRCVRQAMDSNGLFIFDLNTEYALRANMFSQRNLNPNATVQYRWESHYNYGTRICTVDMEFWIRQDIEGPRRHFTEVHRQRGYGLPELNRLLDRAGLVLMSAYDGLSLRPPEPRTDRMYCAARPKPSPSISPPVSPT